MSDFDLRKLLQMVAPVAGGLLAGGQPQQTGFQSGYLNGQYLAKQEREQKQALEQKKREAGAHYLLDVGQHAQGFDDPVQFAQFVNLAEDAGTRAGYIKPGDLRNRVQFPESKTASKKLGELSTQLDALEKGGYNLDELSQSGSHIELKDGTQVPIETALNLTRKRPTDATGKPVARPKKVDTSASTDYGRALARYATKDLGKSVTDLTFAEEEVFKKRYDALNDKPAATPKVSPAGVDAEFADLVELYKAGHGGQEPPAAARSALRRKANAVNDRPTAPSDGPIGAEDVDGAVQAVLSGRMAPSQLTLVGGMGNRGVKFKQAVVAGVNKANPSFNWQQAEAGYKFASSSGTQSTIRFLDNIEKTLPVLQQASDDFKRSGVRVINKALLAGKSQFGNTDVVKFEFARNILADEIAKILQGGGTGNGTSDAKLRQAQDLLSGDMTPDQFSTALATAKELLSTRRESLTRGTFMQKPATGTPKRIMYDMNGNPVQ